MYKTGNDNSSTLTLMGKRLAAPAVKGVNERRSYNNFKEKLPKIYDNLSTGP